MVVKLAKVYNYNIKCILNSLLTQLANSLTLNNTFSSIYKL